MRALDLSGAKFRGVDLTEVVMRGVELVNASVYGEIVNLTINGVDIEPLVNAELDRRYPDRASWIPGGVEHPGAALGTDRGTGLPVAP